MKAREKQCDDTFNQYCVIRNLFACMNGVPVAFMIFPIPVDFITKQLDTLTSKSNNDVLDFLDSKLLKNSC